MKLTKKEEQNLRSYCDYENISFFTRDELVDILGTLKINTSIKNLIRNGVIKSFYKGRVYGLSGKNGPIEELLPRVIGRDEPFYFTGIYVYNARGFIEQLPSKYQVATMKLQREKTIAGFNITFKKVREGFFYGIDETSFMLQKERAPLDFCSR